MTKILTGLLSLFFLSTAGAADLIEQVQTRYRQIDQFQADFVQTTRVEVLDRTVEEKGRVLFARPGRFLIHYQGLRERKFISNGKKLWIVRSDEKEVEVFDRVEGLVSREALVFLGGLGEMTREFEVTQKGSNELVLVPKNGSAPFRKLVLTVDPASHLAEGLTLFPKSGNRSRYLFTAIRLNEKISDKTFQFRP